jgi:hypothetical protein
MILALLGGLIVYGTLLLYIHFFHRQSEEQF